MILGSGDPDHERATVSLQVAVSACTAARTPQNPPAKSPTGKPAATPTPQEIKAEPSALNVLDLLAEQVERRSAHCRGRPWWATTADFSEPYGTAWRGTTCNEAMGRSASALSFADNTIELTVTADPAKPAATLAQWSPDVDYYTLENSMTMAQAAEVAHPGLERRPAACS